MFDTVKNLLKEGEKLVSRFADKATFQRVIAACYLIANADGDFDDNEKKAVANIIKKELPHFELSDILIELASCEEKIRFSSTVGNLELLDIISKAKGTDEAEIIMRICCYIGEADGKFDTDEKLVARDIATRLGLSSSRYGI
tara:strand:+ start:240 stop:668 length:429 start_codon:yes stop_codon:yes gene_type:complete